MDGRLVTRVLRSGAIAAFLACGAAQSRGIAPWPERVLVQPSSACERAVIAGAPALGQRIAALASEVETAPADAEQRGALAIRLTELVIDEPAPLKDNRPDRLHVLTAVRDGANGLRSGNRPPPDAVVALRRLAREVPEEIPRDGAYIGVRCWAMPEKRPAFSPLDVNRSVQAALAIAPAFGRALECRELSSPIPSWPWHPLPEPLRGRLKTCSDELAVADRRCMVEVAPFVDSAEISVLVRTTRFVQTVHAVTEGTLSRTEATLVAERLRGVIDALSPPLSAFPAFAAGRDEVEALPHGDTAAARSRGLYRIQRQLELLTFPCALLGGVEGELQCKLKLCAPPQPG